MFLDAKAQETKKTHFLSCVVRVPTGSSHAKTLPSPLVSGNRFSGLSFCRRGKEPQTVKQRAPLVVVRQWDADAAAAPSAGAAATLVRESDGLHGVVPVARPERFSATTSSAVSGMAPKPLTWMLSASLLELLWLVADVC